MDACFIYKHYIFLNWQFGRLLISQCELLFCFSICEMPRTHQLYFHWARNSILITLTHFYIILSLGLLNIVLECSPLVASCKSSDGGKFGVLWLQIRKLFYEVSFIWKKKRLFRKEIAIYDKSSISCHWSLPLPQTWIELLQLGFTKLPLLVPESCNPFYNHL